MPSPIVDAPVCCTNSNTELATATHGVDVLDAFRCQVNVEQRGCGDTVKCVPAKRQRIPGHESRRKRVLLDGPWHELRALLGVPCGSTRHAQLLLMRLAHDMSTRDTLAAMRMLGAGHSQLIAPLGQARHSLKACFPLMRSFGTLPHRLDTGFTDRFVRKPPTRRGMHRLLLALFISFDAWPPYLHGRKVARTVHTTGPVGWCAPRSSACITRAHISLCAVSTTRRWHASRRSCCCNKALTIVQGWSAAV